MKRLKLYNTESHLKEELLPLQGKHVRMYTCGPTVYNFAHIGNFRTYVFEDILRRTIKFFGFSITQVMNLTDVDDKTIRGALQNNVTLDAFTQPFKKAFFEDLATLNIEKAEHYPQATDYIPEMISIIQTLLDKGAAYVGHDGSVYFAIDKFPSYGRLSHLDIGALQAGASERVSLDEYEKENVCDFVLWKAYDETRDGGIFWESPFGKGRPGWHIECSAMAMKLLGESFDLHVGAVDNIFPHHDNEIAQSEAYSCCRFVKHWLHCEHLLVDHKKMAKSSGNFYTLRDLLQKGYTGPQVRYLLLQAHYRTPLNFTFTALDSAVSSLERLGDFIVRLRQIRKEKMHTALSRILDQALPQEPIVKERLLRALQQEERDLFDADEMRPVLERALPSSQEKKVVLDRILKQILEEKNRTFLTPILQRALQHEPSTSVTAFLHAVEERKHNDLLNPTIMEPVLKKVFAHQADVVSHVLHDLKIKKSHGFVLPLLVTSLQAIQEHLADDLNIASVLAELFDLVRQINALCDQKQIGVSEVEDVLDFLRKVDQVLGVLPLDTPEESIPAPLQEALQRREEARERKDWKEADTQRDLLLAQGYLIEDTPQGARLKRRHP